jgi:hypothetical protein
MHTDASIKPAAISKTDIAGRRILRLAFGASVAMFIAQAFDWQLSFISVILTVVLLGLPLPAPTLKGSVLFVSKLVGAVLGSHLILPFLDHAPMAGILLMALILFGSFYYTAMGGDHLLGTMITLGITLLAAIGSVSIDAFIGVTKALALNGPIAFVFIWIAHTFLPDTPSDVSDSGHHTSHELDRHEAIRVSMRSLAIVLPVAVLFICMTTSTSYVVATLKIASMGQQATADHSRAMGNKLIESTVWGGVGAIIGWAILSACPTLAMYALVIALAGLFYGSKIFKDEGMHPKGAMWQYAFVTMVVILAPTVGSTASGIDAEGRFWFRQCYFLALAIYGWLTVAAFDAFWPKKIITK